LTAAGVDPLVGRERELAQIAAALDGATAGRGQLVLLAGEPGIGKTSLADRAAALAAARGFTVLWGRCWEAGGAPAYWPWLDTLGELARALDGATLTRVLGDGATLLGEIIPEVRARLPEAQVGAAPPVPVVARGERALAGGGEGEAAFHRARRSARGRSVVAVAAALRRARAAPDARTAARQLPRRRGAHGRCHRRSPRARRS
jgi:hypothetical protein